ASKVDVEIGPAVIDRTGSGGQVEKPAALVDAKGAEKPQAPGDANAAGKPAEKPAAPTGAAMTAEKPTEARVAAPLTREQEKAAIEAAGELAGKALNPFVPMTLEDVQKALYGKSEAEIKAIQDAFHRVGLDLEAELRDELDGAELGKALELMRHKDTDLARIPQGVDRAAMTKAAETIHDLAGKAGGSADIAKELAGMRREQIQAMVAL